jgi:hypothetical protein
MEPWIESGAGVVLALCGVYLAIRLARLPKACWLTAWLASLAVVFLFVLQRHVRGLAFTPPFSWVAATR